MMKSLLRFPGPAALLAGAALMVSCEQSTEPTRQATRRAPSFDVSPGGGSWTTKAPMPVPGEGPGVAGINGILYAVGGKSLVAPPFPWQLPRLAFLATVDAYDPVTNTWTPKAPMPTARAALGVGAINGILYAVGGGGSDGEGIDAHGFLP